MIPQILLITVALGLGVPKGNSEATMLPDGQVHQLNDRLFEVWDARNEQWVQPDIFWQRYADRRGGVTWGRGRTYPPYADVKENDTFLVELDTGTCLMEFFHRRWRRANDVRRWGEAFNAYGGCPHVFD